MFLQKSLNTGLDDDFGKSNVFNVGLKVVSARSMSKVTEEEIEINKSSTTTENSIQNVVSSVATKVTINSKSLSFVSDLREHFYA